MKLDTDYPKKDEIKSGEQPEVTQEQNQENVGYRIPTELIELPSKGLLYPTSSPLHKGHIEIKYMTAREEDILTTESFIRKGVVLDKFLQSLIVTEGVNLDDLLIGDIDALTLAARIYGYGNEYDVLVDTPSGKKQREFIDLTSISIKEIDESDVKTKGVNSFDFELPSSKVKISFKLLTQTDQKKFQAEIEKNKKAFSGETKTSSTQLKHQIISVGGDSSPQTIRDFIDNGLLVNDARALRKYIEAIQPGVNLSMEVTDRETGEPFQADITFGVHFFWPDAKI